MFNGVQIPPFAFRILAICLLLIVSPRLVAQFTGETTYSIESDVVLETEMATLEVVDDPDHVFGKGYLLKDGTEAWIEVSFTAPPGTVLTFNVMNHDPNPREGDEANIKLPENLFWISRRENPGNYGSRFSVVFPEGDGPQTRVLSFSSTNIVIDLLTIEAFEPFSEPSHWDQRPVVSPDSHVWTFLPSAHPEIKSTRILDISRDGSSACGELRFQDGGSAPFYYLKGTGLWTLPMEGKADLTFPSQMETILAAPGGALSSKGESLLGGTERQNAAVALNEDGTQVVTNVVHEGKDYPAYFSLHNLYRWIFEDFSDWDPLATRTPGKITQMNAAENLFFGHEEFQPEGQSEPVDVPTLWFQWKLPAFTALEFPSLITRHLVDINALPEGYRGGWVRAASANSRVVAGSLQFSPTSEYGDSLRGFVWTEGKGLEILPQPDSILRSTAESISPTGRIITATVDVAQGNLQPAFWKWNGKEWEFFLISELTDFLDLSSAGQLTFALGDDETVGGWVLRVNGNGPAIPFVWSEKDGFVSIESQLDAMGIEIPDGYKLGHGTRWNTDRSILYGTLETEAGNPRTEKSFILTLEESPPDGIRTVKDIPGGPHAVILHEVSDYQRIAGGYSRGSNRRHAILSSLEPSSELSGRLSAPTLESPSRSIEGISSDGEIIAGNLFLPELNDPTAVRGRPVAAIVDPFTGLASPLPSPEVDRSPHLLGISQDGDLLLGEAGPAFLWEAKDDGYSFEQLNLYTPDEDYEFSKILEGGISGNGEVIALNNVNLTQDTTEWEFMLISAERKGGKPSVIGPDIGAAFWYTDISHDGSVVVGGKADHNTEIYSPMIIRSGLPTNEIEIPDRLTQGYAYGVHPDGDLITGYFENPDGEFRAFLYTQESGLQWAEDYMEQELGIQLGDYSVSHLKFSPEGHILFGRLYTRFGYEGFYVDTRPVGSFERFEGWFGRLSWVESENLYQHQAHGFLSPYVTEDGVYLFDVTSLRWYYMTEDSYPYIWDMKESRWIAFVRSTYSPERWYYDLNTQSFIGESSLD